MHMSSAEQRPTGILPGRDHVALDMRLSASEVVGIAGLALYNWWVVVPFVHGMLPSANGFFSDIEASGLPHASLLQHLDLLSGVLLLATLALRGSAGLQYRGHEWGWLLGFAIAAGAGGKFSYACPEGLERGVPRPGTKPATSRPPLHPHPVGGPGVRHHHRGAVLGCAADSRPAHLAARVYRSVLRLFYLAYPLLGLAYLTDRLGALIEPVFFISFTVLIITHLFEGGVNVGPTRAELRSRRTASTGRSDVAVP